MYGFILSRAQNLVRVDTAEIEVAVQRIAHEIQGFIAGIVRAMTIEQFFFREPLFGPIQPLLQSLRLFRRHD